MPAIPLPFVTALLLVVLLARMAGQGGLARGPLTLFVMLCAAQAVVLGLRWNYDWPAAHLVQPVLAQPPVLWQAQPCRVRPGILGMSGYPVPQPRFRRRIPGYLACQVPVLDCHAP